MYVMFQGIFMSELIVFSQATLVKKNIRCFHSIAIRCLGIFKNKTLSLSLSIYIWICYIYTLCFGVFLFLNNLFFSSY